MQTTITKNSEHLTNYFDLRNDDSIFLDEIEIEILEEDVEYTIINRLIDWTDFFEENKISCLGIYQQTMFALVEAAKSNQLFRTQTHHEYEISLQFYVQLIKSNRFLRTDKIEGARFLLNISLIYGKYPGMVIRSLRKAIKGLVIEESNLIKLFEELFVKYESIKFLTHNVINLSAIEIEAFMFILQGNNIRNFDKLPFPISKKESYYFINAIPSDLFKENILAQSILFAKLMIVKPKHQDRLSEFLSASRTFKYNLDVFYKDLNFWKQAFRIVCEVSDRGGKNGGT